MPAQLASSQYGGPGSMTWGEPFDRLTDKENEFKAAAVMKSAFSDSIDSKIFLSVDSGNSLQPVRNVNPRLPAKFRMKPIESCGGYRSAQGQYRAE